MTGKKAPSKSPKERVVAAKKAPSKSPTKQRQKLAFSVFMILLWAGVSVIASQLIVGWIMVAIMGVDSFVQPVSQAVYSALTYILALFMVIWVPTSLSSVWQQKKAEAEGKSKLEAKRPMKVTRRLLGLNGLPTWTDVGLAPIGFIVSTLIAALLVTLFSLMPWFNATETQSLVFNTYVAGFDRVVAFLTLVVVAPVAEEVIFRGWIYGRLRNKSAPYMSNMASIIVSSLLVSILFGAVHMQWNVAVNVFALSMILCAMREITGTIYAGILTHMIKNGIAFYLLFIAGV